MSFYRTLAATLAVAIIAGPVFADDAVTNATQTSPSAATAQTTPVAAAAADQSAATVTRTNINTASVKDLLKVKGINATKAKAIIAYRKKHGDFKSIDQLASIKGFKKTTTAKLKSIEDQLTIG